MAEPHMPFEPGQRVVVTQQIPQRDDVWTTKIVGQVVGSKQKKTGSWFARAKDDRLWLDRLTIRKDDGELVICVLDQYTHVEVVPEPVASPDDAPGADAPAAGEPAEGETESADAGETDAEGAPAAGTAAGPST